MTPAAIALRVVVGLGVLLAPIGGVPYLYRRLTELAGGTVPGPWGWVQIALHAGVPALLLGQAAVAIRRVRRTDTHP